MASRGALMFSPNDNVATVLEDVKTGAEVPVRLGKEVSKVKSLENVPFGFKIAVTDIAQGTDVIKYGETIGIASQNIKQGELVHVHNMEGGRGRGDLTEGGAE
jgi:altronate dehydratase small subunit